MARQLDERMSETVSAKLRFEYSDDDDVLYVAVGDAMVDRTVEVDPGTLVDVDRMGSMVGIELIRPSRPWPLDAIRELFPLDEDDSKLLNQVASTYERFNPHRLTPA